MRSIQFSKILTKLMFFVTGIMTFFAPYISEKYAEYPVDIGIISGTGTFVPTLVLLYCLEALALFALFILHFLLKNIAENKVFVSQNTKHIGTLSNIFIFAAFIILIYSLFRVIFFPLAFLSFLFGVVMKVLKNVFEKAVEIKSHNDLTI